MQSTIKLFWHLYDHLPPLFPEEVALEMKNELENLDQSGLSLEKIENKMIKFGYEIWPWNQAYKHFLDIARDQVGEHFLLPQMSPGLHKKYLDFKVYGGGLKDLETGRAAIFFTPEERAELCTELVNMRVQLTDYVSRDLIGVNKNKYFEKIEEYEKLLQKIKSNLDSLRSMVVKEEAGSVLAGEINSKIRDFEHGLCLLGTELDYEAVCQAPDFFAGRKVELSRLRGIHIPMQIDFFNS
ncbi:MAG: Uncharacterized protein G01um101413_602 [Parcubacteria group bacterium Gr01-1014_13]|nr:MAG: Uncharacterized protein G01um101413_602 [Parcubacteria group bacterium Gr01-1014_13]